MKSIIIFLLFLSLGSEAGKGVVNDYYNEVTLGEKKFNEYSGPLDPALYSNSHLGSSKFLDEKYLAEYTNSLTQKTFFEFLSFWDDDILAMNSCPNFYLNENIRYIRYLYRLISISYLFESIKEHSSLSYHLGYKEKTCSLDWKEIFGKCKAKSKDMIKFIKRTRYRYLMNYDIRKIKKLSRLEKKRWIKNVLPQEVKKTSNIAMMSIAGSCSGNECRSLTIKSVERALQSSCQEDKKWLNLICSEKDELHGMSWSSVATSLLAGSNVMRTLNEGGFAHACLDRYAQLSQSREVRYERLADVFYYVYKSMKLKISSSSYIEGELFLPGALKEFDDRGLEDFLFVKPKIIEKKLIVIAKITPPPVAKVVKVAIPKIKIKKKIVIKKEKPKPKPLSSFEKAVKKLAENKLDDINVDMEGLRKDFTFNNRMIKALEGPLSDYQTRSALKDMKMYDKLGSRQEPLRLLFLKYLIDRDQHKGLWNVISVIGPTFYLINDIDKKKDPVAVRLLNNKSTRYRWQISILKE